jgi:hypothetical protein
VAAQAHSCGSVQRGGGGGGELYRLGEKNGEGDWISDGIRQVSGVGQCFTAKHGGNMNRLSEI